MNDHSMRPKIVVPDDPSAPDDIAIGRILLSANVLGLERMRAQGELRSAFTERQVNSSADVARAYDVRIEGDYVDADGATVRASIPVQDETTFSPQGMTLRDPALFEQYVAFRTFESMASSTGFESGLTSEEIARLQLLEQTLERSLEGGQP